jgi:hypothetical protein
VCVGVYSAFLDHEVSSSHVDHRLLTELVKILAALFVKIDTDCKVQIENNFKKEKIVGELILSDFRPIITIVIKTV